MDASVLETTRLVADMARELLKAKNPTEAEILLAESLLVVAATARLSQFSGDSRLLTFLCETLQIFADSQSSRVNLRHPAVRKMAKNTYNRKRYWEIKNGRRKVASCNHDDTRDDGGDGGDGCGDATAVYGARPQPRGPEGDAGPSGQGAEGDDFGVPD